jgi:hypothetical protein
MPTEAAPQPARCKNLKVALRAASIGLKRPRSCGTEILLEVVRTISVVRCESLLSYVSESHPASHLARHHAIAAVAKALYQRGSMLRRKTHCRKCASLRPRTVGKDSRQNTQIAYSLRFTCSPTADTLTRRNSLIFLVSYQDHLRRFH